MNDDVELLSVEQSPGHWYESPDLWCPMCGSGWFRLVSLDGWRTWKPQCRCGRFPMARP